MRSVLLMLCISGCVVGDGGDESDVSEIDSTSPLLQRVVIGRIFQKKDWTLKNAGATPAERIAYVCGVLKKLDPTYVSGLIRLDDDAPLQPDQITIFNGVRQCLPNAKFDVVLNAEHYTDPKLHDSGKKAYDALQARADEIKNTLHADIVFFDFFSSPYNSDHQGWYRDALTNGTHYIKQIGLRVAGNVWGLDLPPNTDIVALDNFDRANTDGYEFDKTQIKRFKGKAQIMLHVENNPQKPGSKGLQWMNGNADYRRGVLDKYSGDQHAQGFSYMFPVFFPLKCCAGGTCGPDTCNKDGNERISYDASQDGMIQKIDGGLGK